MMILGSTPCDVHILLERLESALRQPLPGAAAQALMSPRPRRDWPPGFAPGGVRQAAGLLLLFPIDTTPPRGPDGSRAHARPTWRPGVVAGRRYRAGRNIRTGSAPRSARRDRPGDRPRPRARSADTHRHPRQRFPPSPHRRVRASSARRCRRPTARCPASSGAAGRHPRSTPAVVQWRQLTRDARTYDVPSFVVDEVAAASGARQRSGAGGVPRISWAGADRMIGSRLCLIMATCSGPRAHVHRLRSPGAWQSA